MTINIKTREKWKLNHICSACGVKQAREGKSKCQECVDADVVYQRERRHRYKSLGLCVCCGNPAMINADNDAPMKYCSRCSEVKNANARKNNKILKVKVLSYYSNGEPCCACCSEKEIDFLSIDHINGGGNKHLKTFEVASTCGGSIYRWIKKHNYPSGFRVLCFNCNFAIGAFGSCPHQRLKQ